MMFVNRTHYPARTKRTFTLSPLSVIRPLMDSLPTLATLAASQRPASADNSQQNDYNRNDEKHMDETAHGVGADQSKQP